MKTLNKWCLCVGEEDRLHLNGILMENDGGVHLKTAGCLSVCFRRQSLLRCISLCPALENALMHGFITLWTVKATLLSLIEEAKRSGRWNFWVKNNRLKFHGMKLSTYWRPFKIFCFMIAPIGQMKAREWNQKIRLPFSLLYRDFTRDFHRA